MKKSRTKPARQSEQKAWWPTLLVLSLIGLVVMFDETMILPAIPDFIRDFGISYSEASWLLSGYIIAAAVMTPIAGKLSDIYGRKRVLLIVMGVYMAGVVLGRFADGIEIMVVARMMQGVGMAMFPIAFGIIRETLPMDRLSIGQTIFSAMFPTGAVIGLVGGAAIIQWFGWQMTFVAILPVSLALWLLIFKVIKDPVRTGPPADRTIDFKGIAALATTIVLFLMGITMVESGSGMQTVALLFAAAGVSLGIFAYVEKRARSPIIDFKLMRSRAFLPPTVILLLTFLSMFMVYLTVPVLVRSPAPLGFGGDAVAVAGTQLPFMAIFLAGTISSGFILDRVRNTRLVVIGSVISTAGFLLLLASHSTQESVSVGLAVIAVGLSLCMTGGFNVILVSVPPQATGSAMGMTMLLNLIGMSTGPALAGMLQQTHQGSVPGFEGTFPTAEAYTLIFSVSVAFALVSLALAVMLARSAPKAGKTKNMGH